MYVAYIILSTWPTAKMSIWSKQKNHFFVLLQLPGGRDHEHQLV